MQSSTLKLRELGLHYSVAPVNEIYLSKKDREFKNHVYSLWKDIWTKVFAATGRADDLSPDEFYRQNLLVCIRTHEEVIGLHLYSTFDLRDAWTKEHSYFDGTAPSTFEKLTANKCLRLMTMEYLTINPRWRKSETGIAWSEIQMALGLEVMRATGHDAAIGTARVDVKVDKNSQKIGFVAYQEGIKKYDYSVNFMVCRSEDIRRHPDESTAEMIDYLWKTRVDSAGLTFPHRSQSANKAA